MKRSKMPNAPYSSRSTPFKTMKHITIIFFCLFITNVAFGQPKTPNEYGLKHYSLNDNLLGNINFYVTKNGIDKHKPLMILLDGSGNLPLYSLMKNNDGTSHIFGSIPFRYKKLSEKYHVILISKPGTPFLDSLNVNTFQEFVEQYQPSKEYSEKLSLGWRVNSASKVIDFLTNELDIDENKIIAIGYSEGGQVVPNLALKNNKITKIVNIVGGGLNQFYDFISAERLKVHKGIISADIAQNKIDSLNLKFKEIYKNPNATDKFWLGHTYKRWASFCKDIPLEDMLKLDIPILLVSGGYDESSPITGIDYVELEFLRQGKENLTYKVYPNCDHWFNDQALETNRLTEMLNYVIEWIEK